MNAISKAFTRTALAPAFLALLAPSAGAGVFPPTGLPQTYTLADNTTALGDGSQVYATVDGAFSSAVASVQNNALRLCPASPLEPAKDTASRLLLSVIDTGKVVSAFNVSFDLSVSSPAPATAGEGFSVNFGAIPGVAGNGETGFNMSNGLSIGWDLKDNGGENPAINIYANSTLIAQFPATGFSIPMVDAAPVYRPVIINWDSDGLDVTWGGEVICENVATPGFIPANNNRIAFSGRTSPGATAEVSLDNLFAYTTAVDPLATGGPVIWEFMARNQSAIEDDDFDHPDYIELYNGQSSSVNLEGWTLTNDPAVPGKWAFPALTIPANGFTYVYASGKNRTNAAHFHTSFTLPGEGGYLALANPEGEIKSAITYGPQYDDVPSGYRSAVEPLSYMSAASPGASNNTEPGTTTAIAFGSDVITEKPVFTDAAGVPQESGFITGTTTIVIAPPATPGAVVRYSINGTQPTESSGTVYSGPIPVTTSRAIRARIFAPGLIGGPPKTLSLVSLGSDLTNYRGTGQPFRSNLPLLVMDSFGVGVDSATDPAGARPARFTYGMVFDPASGSTEGMASLGDVPAYAGPAGTHVRGQSSSGFPQKPYALEWWNSDDEDKNVSILGMPADSDWVLYNPHNEETLMRNAVVYELMFRWRGEGAGLRARFVEVFFNQSTDGLRYSDYRGIYLLVEKIKRASGRLPIEKLNAEVTDPGLNTGGYLWKKDKPPQPITVSTTSTGAWGGQTFEVVEPNLPNTLQRTWLQNYIKAFDTSLMSANWRDPVSGYRQYADTGSFVDNLNWVEAFKQIDGYRLSSYFYKTREGKITALPVWDYNLSSGNANYLAGENPSGWYYAHLSGGNLPYWPRLLQDADFVRERWDRYWKARRSVFSDASVRGIIDSFEAQLTAGDPRPVENRSRSVNPAAQDDFDTPVSRHFYKWQVLGSYQWPNCNNYAVRTTYQSETNFLREWMRQRLDWMDYQSLDGSAGLAKMRPPNVHDRVTGAQVYSGTMAAGFAVDLKDPNGTAGSTIYYTVNGADPRTAAGAVDPSALTANGATSATTTFISNGSTWDYYASRTAAPADAGGFSWMQPAYPAAWTNVPAPVGYGESGMATTLPAAEVPTGNSNQVTYFRKTFTVPDPAAVYELILELNADDGAVVYLNGQEATRANMPYPPNAITFASRATGLIQTVADSEAENIFVPFRVDPALLVAGTNTLAVEVHQFSSGSPNPNTSALADMRFDLRLKGINATPQTTPLTLTSGPATLRARVKTGSNWSPLTEAEFIVGAAPAAPGTLVVSEFMYDPAAPTLAESAASGANAANDFEYIELLNISDHAIDLTGVRVQDAISFDFTTADPSSRYLQPGQRALLVENSAAFLARYPGREAQIAGTFFSGNLRNGGELFTLLAADGVTRIQQFTWSDENPWPTLAGLNPAAGEPDYSLVLVNPYANPDPANPENWRASPASRGNPGNADATTPPPAQPLADLNGNGVADLLDWAMGSATSTASVAAETWTPPGGAPDRYLVFRFPVNPDAAGLTVSVEQSADLTTWTATGFVFAGTEYDSRSRPTLLYRSPQPVPATGRLYLRARVNGNAP